LRIGLDLCHFLVIIQKTKEQSSFTIASKSSQMLLIHPMIMGINGLYVMKQAGFCVEGRGELGLIHVIFWP
jgi:uncharacterized membrane protein